jgi:hypothetical protein
MPERCIETELLATHLSFSGTAFALVQTSMHDQKDGRNEGLDRRKGKDTAGSHVTLQHVVIRS